MKMEQLDHETYQLKNTFYNDVSLEQKLCENTIKSTWKTMPTFIENIHKLQQNKNKNGVSYPLLDREFYLFIVENQKVIESIRNDVNNSTEPFFMTFFGLQTLQNKYLLKSHDGYHESVEYLWLRISLFVHGNDWENVRKMYSDLRQGNYIHATPTLFNAGLVHHQMASCFRAGTKILTTDGIQNIEDIKVGTEVLTHYNSWKKVIQTHKNPIGRRRMLKVRFSETLEDIYVTEDHPFLVYDHEKKECFWKEIGDCSGEDKIIHHSSFDFHESVNDLYYIWNGIEYLMLLNMHSQLTDYFTIKIKNHYRCLFEKILKLKNARIVKKSTSLLYTEYIILYSGNIGSNSIPELFSINTKQFNLFLKGLYMVYRNFRSAWTIDVKKQDLNTFKVICSFYNNKVQQIYNTDENVYQLYLKNFYCVEKKSQFATIKDKRIVFQADDFVYTLGVDEFHSYTLANGIMVKNCFLLGNEDSIRGIYKSIGDCALISKYAGGVGLHCHSIRSNGAYIYGTNGHSNGIIPMLKVYNDTARYVDQGGGKRNGSFAIYLECWHSDIFEFLLLKKNVGSEETRARDLFYALWVSDYFMQCVEQDSDWFLMDPSTATNLNLSYGDDFKRLYQKYIVEEKYTKKVKARELWKEICRIQIETGTPYILYKDRCNELSNQKNLGTIQSSNLCCEIIQYSNEKEYAVCNLASVSLPKCLVANRNMKDIENVEILSKDGCDLCLLSKHFLRKYNIQFTETKNVPCQKYPQIFINDECIGGFKELWEQYLCPEFDYEKLGERVESIVMNLNQIIDKNMYPLEECKDSNMRHRPMGIGVQGLADVFMELLEPYDSNVSRQLNRRIFECMYYHAIKKSVEIAKVKGSYSSFYNSPLSKGQFHFELYKEKYNHSLHHDWETLRKNVMEHGCFNSLFIALMPTASTSQILGNTESFEPLTSNFYTRRVLTGEYYVINRILQSILKGMNLWDETMNEQLTLEKGSLQKISRIPSFLKPIFRTIWEIPQKSTIEMAGDRQRFVDQSQSMNIYLTNPSVELLTKIHFYGWKKELKTGCYYVRSRSLTKSQNFFIDAKKEQELQECENCSA